MTSRRVAAGLSISLALAACGAEREAPAPEPPAAQVEAPAPEKAQPGAAVPMATVVAAPAERWLLAEFAWGDSEEVVYESVEYTDGFLCYEHKLFEHCAFVKTKVDGEELLAKFAFVDGRLWRIEVLTPELDASQADAHLERVWKLLVGYVTRFYGEAPEQQPLPARAALAPKAEVVTRRWTLPDQEIRIVVGRAEGEKWFASARFTDPKWADRAPPPEPPKPAAKSAPQR
jgi:hypothetical protein